MISPSRGAGLEGQRLGGEGTRSDRGGSAVLDWLTGGSALAALGRVSFAVCALVIGLVYRRYLGILGTDRRKPAERRAYDALRDSLAEGNLAARLYAQRLTRFLDWIDRFFGDAGMADRTLFPHAFGLRTPAPLWTSRSFDRCLLLALIYPVGAIFVIWAISGHIGPAEAALSLAPGLPPWRRGLTFFVFSFMSMAFSRVGRGSDWWRVAWGAVGLGIGIAAVRIAGVSSVATTVAGGVGVAVSGAFSGGTVVAYAVGIAVAYPIGVSVAEGFIYTAAAVSVAAAYAVLSAVEWANDAAVNRGWQGRFQFFLVMMLIVACLIAARLLSPSYTWKFTGPFLLFLGLLTLLNAPFDWASLGLTRALLRRGLELGAWWPYALALVDAALAAVIIAALALTMVMGVQAFDALAVHGGGAAVLPLEPLFTGIAEHPTTPEYWWLYALLLSTMIPSLVNLVIGGTSLVRGLPGAPTLLLRYIPERGDVLKWDRHWIATVLTTQVAAGAALGIAAQVFLVWVIIGHVMPFFGLELLDMARGVADFNLPARVGRLFGVSLQQAAG
jgi:hypothetical protein